MKGEGYAWLHTLSAGTILIFRGVSTHDLMRNAPFYSPNGWSFWFDVLLRRYCRSQAGLFVNFFNSFLSDLIFSNRASTGNGKITDYFSTSLTEEDFEKLFDDDDVVDAVGGGVVRQDNEDDNLFCDDLEDAELVSVAPDVKRPKMWYFFNFFQNFIYFCLDDKKKISCNKKIWINVIFCLVFQVFHAAIKYRTKISRKAFSRKTNFPSSPFSR